VWKCEEERYGWLAGSCTVLSEEESHGLALHFLFLAQTQRSQWESFLFLGTVVPLERSNRVMPET